MLRQANSISLRAFWRCSKNSGGRNALRLARISSRAARACWRTSSGILPSKWLRRVVFSFILTSLSCGDYKPFTRLWMHYFIPFILEQKNLVWHVESARLFKPVCDSLNCCRDIVVRNIQSEAWQHRFGNQLTHLFLLMDEW